MQGEKAAWLLLRAAQGKVKPVLVASKINMMQTAMRATTIIAEVATQPLPPDPPQGPSALARAQPFGPKPLLGSSFAPVVFQDGSVGPGGAMLKEAKAAEDAGGWVHPYLDPWENVRVVGSRHYGSCSASRPLSLSFSLVGFSRTRKPARENRLLSAFLTGLQQNAAAQASTFSQPPNRSDPTRQLGSVLLLLRA